MKALTICQPYAELIASGCKLIENRTWPTSHRGRIAIHAGRSRAWLDDEYTEQCGGAAALVFGAIVATAELYDCIRVEDLPPLLLDNEHANGPWCWLLRDVHRVNPRPCRGALGLWEAPDAD